MYDFEIFLSYKRHPESRRWIVDHFQPLLAFYVGLELGRDPRIFRDDNDIEAGTDWPVEIARSLANSCTVVALWTKTYFNSQWCALELSTILARRLALSSGTTAPRLVVPVVLHDCESLPTQLAALQAVSLKDYYNPRMQRDSLRAEALADQIARNLAPSVAHAIQRAPAWQESWPLEAAQQFLDELHRGPPAAQTTVPGFAR